MVILEAMISIVVVDRIAGISVILAPHLEQSVLSSGMVVSVRGFSRRVSGSDGGIPNEFLVSQLPSSKTPLPPIRHRLEFVWKRRTPELYLSSCSKPRRAQHRPVAAGYPYESSTLARSIALASHTCMGALRAFRETLASFVGSYAKQPGQRIAAPVPLSWHRGVRSGRGASMKLRLAGGTEGDFPKCFHGRSAAAKRVE